jgi:hypothetical protein
LRRSNPDCIRGKTLGYFASAFARCASADKSLAMTVHFFSSCVGWAKAPLRRAHHPLAPSFAMVGTLRFAHPCMGLWKSRGRHCGDSFFGQFLGSTEGVSSSRPRFCRASRAAVVKAGRHDADATANAVSRPRLDEGEHGARLDGRDDRSRDRRQDMILDWATNDACGKLRITLYSVRDQSPVPQSFMRGRRQGPVKTGPIYETGVSKPRVGSGHASVLVHAGHRCAAVQRLGRSTAPVGTTPVTR